MEHRYNNLSTQEIQHRYEFMEAAAQTLGAHAVEMAKGEINVRVKSDGSRVTDIDETLNEMLIDMTHQYFPHDLVWGEEVSNSDKGDLEAARRHWLWIADPIDGTSKLIDAHEAADFSECRSTVLLSAFAPGMISPVMSAVYSPFRREQMLVSAGLYGALASTVDYPSWPLHVPAITQRPEDIAQYEYSRWGNGLERLPDVLSAARRVKTPVRMASVALGMAELSAFPLEAHPHDVIAGAHVVHAAGGTVRSLTGMPYEQIDWRVDPVDGVMAGQTPELVDAVLQRL